MGYVLKRIKKQKNNPISCFWDMVDLKYEKSEKLCHIFFSSDFDDNFFGYESDDFKKKKLNKKIPIKIIFEKFSNIFSSKIFFS